MRLNILQKEALKQALKNTNAKAYLFGSRTDPQKKGGDVDLLLFSKDDPFELSRKVTVGYQMVCDEKIDVIVMDPNNLAEEQENFLTLIKKVRINWQPRVLKKTFNQLSGRRNPL